MRTDHFFIIFTRTLVFSKLHCRDVSFFLFSFVPKPKTGNKLLYSTQTFFKHIFYFSSLICVFVLFFGYVFVFFVLLARAKSFRKKNKKFKTVLMTSFILLLTCSKLFFFVRFISTYCFLFDR